MYMRCFLLFTASLFAGVEGTTIEPTLLVEGFSSLKEPVYFAKAEGESYLLLTEEEEESTYRIALEKDVLNAEDIGAKLTPPSGDIALHEDGSLWMIASVDEEMANISRMDPLGKTHTMVRSLYSPASLRFSPDYTALYVMEKKGRGYELYLSANGEEKRLSDTVFSSKELEVDREGKIYLIADQEVQVLSKEGATVATVVLDEEVTGLCFGGGETLFITTTKSLWSISLASLGN